MYIPSTGVALLKKWTGPSSLSPPGERAAYLRVLCVLSRDEDRFDYVFRSYPNDGSINGWTDGGGPLLATETKKLKQNSTGLLPHQG